MRRALYALAISLLAMAGGADAASALPVQDEGIDGVAIVPGVERLSYISPSGTGLFLLHLTWRAYRKASHSL